MKLIGWERGRQRETRSQNSNAHNPSKIFTFAQLLKTRPVTEYAPVEYPGDFP